MTVIDRRFGVAEGTAVKAPCRVATTANIALSGLQTIDGVTLAEGDRVLVKNQSTGSQNGIYSASSGNWTRTKDFDGSYDVVTGTKVFVTAGTVSSLYEYAVTTTGTITIDSTSISFSITRAANADASATAAAASAAAAAASAAAAAASAATSTAGTGTVMPSGRITLTSATPVPSADVASATTVYYTPFSGNIVPIYNGTDMVQTVFTELSQATTDTTKSPAAVGTNKVYDLFVWNDSGTIRCTRGPAWTNSTTRGYTLTMTNGILLNASSITNGPAALRGTYVGTIGSNGSSAIDYVFGASGTGGSPASLLVWNAYNRVLVSAIVVDNGTSYTYTTAQWRQARGTANMQVKFVTGLSQDSASAIYQIYLVTAAVGGALAQVSLGYNTTSAASTGPNFVFGNGALGVVATLGNWTAPIGVNILSGNEKGDGTNANTFQQNGTSNQLGLNFSYWM